MNKSPVEIMQTEMKVQMESGIMKAVQDVGINVDKAELLKALSYDREQYQKGYADGREAGHEWISVEDRLPENGQQVLIYDGNATQWKASVHSARFVKGRTHDEIMAEYRDTGRLWHTFGDEEGNNKKPYAWRGDAHMQWFGQQVTYWMPLPEPPKEE